MAESQFLKRILGDPVPEPDGQPFSSERQPTAQSFSLHVEFRDGLASEGVAWSHFGRYRWRDMGTHETLRIIFGSMCAVEITGHNLGALVTEVRNGQLNGIREMASGQVKLGQAEGADGPLITAVKSYPDFDAVFEALMQEGKDEDHEAGYAGRVRRR